jgi:type II secretion system protein G
MKSTRQAFTLIELLIAVAIIAILAAIAVPNFLSAQTRAKVSRAKSELRTLTEALEAYAVDHSIYPPCNAFGTPGNRRPLVEEAYLYLERLSTPTAYLTNAFPEDPFGQQRRYSPPDHAALSMLAPIENLPADGPQWRSYTYTSWNGDGRTTAVGDGFDIRSLPRAFALQSSGPDGTYFNTGGILEHFTPDETLDVIYDPTNGAISFGSIFRVGGDDTTPYGGGFQAGVRGVVE